MRERVLKCEESRYWLKLRQGKESKVVGRKEIKYGREEGELRKRRQKIPYLR